MPNMEAAGADEATVILPDMNKILDEINSGKSVSEAAAAARETAVLPTAEVAAARG